MWKPILWVVLVGLFAVASSAMGSTQMLPDVFATATPRLPTVVLSRTPSPTKTRNALWLGEFSPSLLNWIHSQVIGHIFADQTVAGFIVSPRLTPTKTSDTFWFRPEPNRTLSWGVGRGGPIFYHVVYDIPHGIVAYETGGTTWFQSVVEFVSTPPPTAIPSTNLAGRKSAAGIGLGSRMNVVERVFGKAQKTALGSGLSAAYYECSQKANPVCSKREHTVFLYRARRVVAVSYAAGD